MEVKKRKKDTKRFTADKKIVIFIQLKNKTKTLRKHVKCFWRTGT